MLLHCNTKNVVLSSGYAKLFDKFLCFHNNIDMSVLDIVLYTLVGVLVIVIVVCLAIANYAGSNLVAVFEQYEKYSADFFDTLTLAKKISQGEFGGNIKVGYTDGFLSDYYYNRTIYLSSRVASASNISAFAVCAHELGHAIQYRDEPQKMLKFGKRIRLSNVLSKFTLPLFVIGIVCIFINILLAIAILTFSVVMFLIGLVTKLSTIKIEKEASENGIKLLQKYANFDETQVRYAKKVLSSAKLTYIASFLKSMLKWTMLVNKYDFY